MGQTYVQYYNESNKVPLSSHFEYLWESKGKLTFEQMLSQRGEFTAYTDNNANFGLSKQGLWLRVTIDNLSQLNQFAVSLNFSQIDYVDFYIQRENGSVTTSKQGKSQGEQGFRMPAVLFSSNPGDSINLYLRVQSDSSPLIVPTFFQSIDTFSFAAQLDTIIWGAFYGALLILAVYNLALYYNVRHISILCYIAYIGTIIFWQFVWGGHIQLIFTDGQPLWFVAHTEWIFILIGISSGFFTLSFLDTDSNAPKASLAVKISIFFLFVLGVISAFDFIPPVIKHNLVYYIGSIASLTYISAGFEAFFNRFKPALYFIVAWSFVVTGLIAGMFSLIGVLPSNNITINCFQAGVFFEVLLFSFAIMAKTQSELQNDVEHATNDLRNNMEVIEEQNARLDIARKDAIKASNIKSQFLANMSHEIRTPLNAILGFGRELENAGLALTEHEQVKIVNSAAQNLLLIVNDVLDFSKIEAGKLHVNNSPFSPLEVFEEMVAIMAKTAHSKNLDFIFDSSPLPDKIISDSIRLKQVLTNLIGNALKFTSKGSVTLTVSAKHRQHGVIELFFDVTDTGIGISQIDRKKLFSAFSQVDDSTNRSFRGTGLGLVISQQLVKLMNGSIELKSEPGVGTTFSVMVRASHINQRSAFSYPYKVSNINVVIFDPHPTSRQATTKMLEALGAFVVPVSTLDDLQKIQTAPNFLMVFLPNQSPFSEIDVMRCAMNIKAKAKIVWYCNDDPLKTVSHFNEEFDKSMSLPATPSRLAQIIAIDLMPTSKHQLIPTPNNVSSPQDELPAISLLAVDDMPMNLSLLDAWLKSSPISLTKAYSGEQAVGLCQQHVYDLILMDVQMPNMDGVAASKAIRKIDLNMGTPIIAVTAHAFKEEQDRLLSSGMDDYLPKPLSLEALIDTIKQWCDGIDSDREIKELAVNWNLALSRTNQNTETAMKLMHDFLHYLPQAQLAIENAVASSDMKSLKDEVHKLHGASCYTGAPVIQSLAEAVEIEIKQKQHDKAIALLPKLYNALADFKGESQNLLS
nr:hybrid sensor histidine kinase/response regulator [Alteromonas sp. 5E99-2]